MSICNRLVKPFLRPQAWWCYWQFTTNFCFFIVLWQPHYHQIAATMDKNEQSPVVELSIAPTRTLSQQDSNGTNLSLWQSVRKWPKIVGYSLGLTSAILLWGFDTSIVGNVSAVPSFQYGCSIFMLHILIFCQA